MRKFTVLVFMLVLPTLIYAEEFSKANELTGLFPIRAGKWGYVDKTCKIVIQPQFDSAKNFSEGLAAVEISYQWGYIDKTGKIVITPQFDYLLEDFSEDLARVSIGKKYGYIDKTGKIVITPQFDKAGNFSEGLALVGVSDAGKNYGTFGWGYIDKTGKYVITPHFADAGQFSEGLAPAKTGVKIPYTDKDRTGFLYGYIDKTGKYVIKPQFDEARKFSEGLAKAHINGKEGGSGYIDKTGKFVVNAQQFDFESGRDFSEGLAVAGIGLTYGYIDKTGKFVIKPIFDVASEFSEGLAQVKLYNKVGYIDKTGEYVCNPFQSCINTKTCLAEKHIYRGSDNEVAFAELVGQYYGLFIEGFHDWTEGYDEDKGAKVFSGVDVTTNIISKSKKKITSKQGIIMEGQAGSLWAAVIDGDNVRYFTNVVGDRKIIPKAIDSWRESFQDKKVIFQN